MGWNSTTFVFLLSLFAAPLLAQPSKPLSGLNLEGLRETKRGELRWQDNPFVQPVEPLDVQDLSLTAIVSGKSDSACLINGEVLRVGNKIGFSEVLHIEKNHVVLRNENGIFSLSLKGGAQKQQQNENPK